MKQFGIHTWAITTTVVKARNQKEALRKYHKMADEERIAATTIENVELDYSDEDALNLGAVEEL
jgi:hypothetical protein